MLAPHIHVDPELLELYEETQRIALDLTCEELRAKLLDIAETLISGRPESPE